MIDLWYNINDYFEIFILILIYFDSYMVSTISTTISYFNISTHLAIFFILRYLRHQLLVFSEIMTFSSQTISRINNKRALMATCHIASTISIFVCFRLLDTSCFIQLLHIWASFLFLWFLLNESLNSLKIHALLCLK